MPLTGRRSWWRSRRVNAVLAALCAVAALIVTWSAWQALRPVDLIVYAATPQGVTAAVSASRHGLKVVLVEPSDRVGGVISNAWLTTFDLPVDCRGRLLNRGIFAEYFRALGHDPSFDLEDGRRALEDLLRGTRVQLRLGQPVASLEVRAGAIRALTVAGPGGRPDRLTARYFVDASDAADLAAQAGAPFTLGREDSGLGRDQMAATLIFRLRGLSWEQLAAALRAEADSHHDGAQAHGRTAAGFNQQAWAYVPSDPARFALRGLNLARQDDGSVLVNALQIYGVDATNPAAVAAAYRAALPEVSRVVAHLRASAPQVFGTARLAGVAPALYLRESRHLVSASRLRADDVLLGRSFPDSLVLGGFALDGQVYRRGEAPYLLGRPLPYGVPLGSLLPQQGPWNLLVVSQAAGFDSAAAFSARVVPLQMGLGEAAGEAIAAAAAAGRGPAWLERNPEALRGLRQDLLAHGVLQADRCRSARPTVDDELARKAVLLLRRGLFSGLNPRAPGLGLDRTAATNVVADFQHLYAARSGAWEMPTRLRLAWEGWRSGTARALSGEEFAGWLDAFGYVCGWCSQLKRVPNWAVVEVLTELWQHWAPQKLGEDRGDASRTPRLARSLGLRGGTATAIH